MTPSLIIGALWVLAAAATAMLPMRRQYGPGLALLALAPVLLGWIAYDHGVWIFGLGLAAFASMFRNPLRYFWRRAWGQSVEVPE